MVLSNASCERSPSPVLRFEEAFELPDAGRMAHLAQRFGFDLADAFAGDLKLAAHFFERAAVAIHQAKALFEHLTFAFGESVQHVLDLILKQDDSRHVGGIFGALILDEIAETRVVRCRRRATAAKSAAAPS